MKLDLQFFGERGIELQSSEQLRKGIESLEEMIRIHQDKLQNPSNYYAGWEVLDKREQNGTKRHWLHEIEVFEESILNRKTELSKRGEFYG